MNDDITEDGNALPIASGRFVLRMPAGLHLTLRNAAEAADLSLNEYCIRKLTAGGIGPAWAAPLLARASATVGDDLEGVVIFGSWARGEATDASDLDVLIVVGEGRAITRDLYRGWDAAKPIEAAFEVEPHFVKLPDEQGGITGLWAEVAIDGLVLFERDFDLSRRLASFRRRIAAGEIVRRWAGGQAYWVAA